MKKGSFFADIIGLSSGYFTANPDGDILSNVTTLLNTSPVISQGAADDIAKMLAGLVVTIISRWIFSKIDRKKEKKPEVKTEPQQQKPPQETEAPQNISFTQKPTEK